MPATTARRNEETTMLIDYSHLNAIQIRLSNERAALFTAISQSEVALRKVWIAQIERELAAEREFIAMRKEWFKIAKIELSDDELLAQLSA